MYYKDIIFVVSNSNLKNKIITTFHEFPLADHIGFFKTQINQHSIFLETIEIECDATY